MKMLFLATCSQHELLYTVFGNLAFLYRAVSLIGVSLPDFALKFFVTSVKVGLFLMQGHPNLAAFMSTHGLVRTFVVAWFTAGAMSLCTFICR